MWTLLKEHEGTSDWDVLDIKPDEVSAEKCSVTNLVIYKMETMMFSTSCISSKLRQNWNDLMKLVSWCFLQELMMKNQSQLTFDGFESSWKWSKSLPLEILSFLTIFHKLCSLPSFTSQTHKLLLVKLHFNFVSSTKIVQTWPKYYFSLVCSVHIFLQNHEHNHN